MGDYIPRSQLIQRTDDCRAQQKAFNDFCENFVVESIKEYLSETSLYVPICLLNIIKYYCQEKKRSWLRGDIIKFALYQLRFKVAFIADIELSVQR